MSLGITEELDLQKSKVKVMYCCWYFNQTSQKKILGRGVDILYDKPVSNYLAARVESGFRLDFFPKCLPVKSRLDPVVP